VDTNTLIAHRGDNTNYPENTLIAIEAALKAGATSFEFDVQMNADHSLVAFHDRDFSRMSGNSDEKIYDVSDSEMSLLSVHEPNQFAKQHYPTRVTYIDEIIELLKKYPKAQAYVEIKDESLEHWGVEFVMKKLLTKLQGLETQAIIISFNVAALAYTKSNSQFRIGLVFEEYSDTYRNIALQLMPEFMICWYKILPDENVWPGDWKWMVYTVNEASLAKRLMKRGDIDFVETDDINLLLDA